MLKIEKRRVSNVPLFCDNCGDQTVVICPCKFTFHDGVEIPFNLCLDCVKGTITIDLARKRLVAKILKRFRDRKKVR